MLIGSNLSPLSPPLYTTAKRIFVKRIQQSRQDHRHIVSIRFSLSSDLDLYNEDEDYRESDLYEDDDHYDEDDMYEDNSDPFGNEEETESYNEYEEYDEDDPYNENEYDGDYESAFGFDDLIETDDY